MLYHAKNHTERPLQMIDTVVLSKTGILTKGEQTVQKVWRLERSDDQLVHTMLFAANTSTHDEPERDPLDTAFTVYALGKGAQRPSHPPLQSLPFKQGTALSGNLWHNGSEYDLTIKGAPERLLPLCDLTENEYEQAIVEFHKLASSGYHVIAVAHKTLTRPMTRFDALNDKEKLIFDGLVAIIDELRYEVGEVIKETLRTSTNVLIITGEHLETAYRIGRQLGIVHSRNEVYDTQQISLVTDEEVDHIITTVRIFARATPEHKRRILTLLKNRGPIAMTGNNVDHANTHFGIDDGEWRTTTA
jgi:Ca2+-transporting ATPase